MDENTIKKLQAIWSLGKMAGQISSEKYNGEIGDMSAYNLAIVTKIEGKTMILRFPKRSVDRLIDAVDKRDSKIARLFDKSRTTGLAKKKKLSAGDKSLLAWRAFSLWRKIEKTPYKDEFGPYVSRIFVTNFDGNPSIMKVSDAWLEKFLNEIDEKDERVAEILAEMLGG